MKVIFLDIDGVLNDVNSLADHVKEHHNNNCIVAEMVERVNKIIEATEAKVVISSTWRLLHKLEDLVIRLEDSGFRGEVIGKTPITHESRGLEIQKWLDDNPVDSFVILDDSSDMVHLMDHLVLTQFFNGGLQDEHVAKAISVLKGD